MLPAENSERRLLFERWKGGPRSNVNVRVEAQVELPLGATEDRICGTIDIEKALQEGVKAYEPGLLVRTLHHAQASCVACLLGTTKCAAGMAAVGWWPPWSVLLILCLTSDFPRTLARVRRQSVACRVLRRSVSAARDKQTL